MVHGELIRELSKIDSFEGCDESTVWLARLIARMKWGDTGGFPPKAISLKLNVKK